MVALTESGATGMVTTDLPEKLPGLDACAACVAAKEVQFPYEEGCSCAGDYLCRVHIDIARPMQVKSAGGKEYEWTTTLVQSTQLLRLKSEVPGGFKVFKAVPENES